MDRLKKDIPKYISLTSPEREWWQEFLNDTEKSILTEVRVPTSWPFDRVLAISKRCPRVNPEVENVPEQLKEMHSAETRKIPEVCYNVHVCIRYRTYQCSSTAFKRACRVSCRILGLG